MSVFQKGRTAVVTGAASGIGRAACLTFAKLGMNIVMADSEEQKLKKTAEALSEHEGHVVTMKCDVTKIEHLQVLAETAYSEFGKVDVLMNNAGISGDKDQAAASKGLANWHQVFDVNFWGQRNGLEAFVEKMKAQNSPAAIINTGSKQGITNPPGNGAYNCSKAAVKSMTEHLAWELRQQPRSQVSAHLLVPGWTFTGLTGDDGTAQKPDGAWSAQQVVDMMIEYVNNGKFYIICPDNSVDAATDAARMRWNVEDICTGRPALSRWSDEYKGKFERTIDQLK